MVFFCFWEISDKDIVGIRVNNVIKINVLFRFFMQKVIKRLHNREY